MSQDNIYVCLNCNTPHHKPEEIEDVAITGWWCETCNWHNTLSEDHPGDITPITIIRKRINDVEYQVCYPEIEEKDLKELPPELKNAVDTFFRNPEKFNKNMKDNIRHNLYEKNYAKFNQIATKYKNKAKFVWFFQHTNLFKKKRR